VGLVDCASYPRTEDDPAGHFVRGHAEWLAAHAGDVHVLACADAPLGGWPHALRTRPWRAASITARLFVAARRHRFDAVVCHWLVPCALVGRTLGVPLVAVAHGSDVALLRKLPGAAGLLRRIDHLVYVDESLRMTAHGIVQAMPPQATARLDRDEARKALGVDGRVALFVGRLVREKGLDLLLDALPDDMTLLVAGEGPEDLSSHARVRSGAARLLGEQRGHGKARLFAAADLLVVPSRRDGAPTVIGEAHGAGLPVLGTDVGGIPACVRGGGWVVPPTVSALRQALDRLKLPVDLPSPATWATVGPRLWPFPTRQGRGAIQVERY